jgi:hypothetical protein
MDFGPLARTHDFGARCSLLCVFGEGALLYLMAKRAKSESELAHSASVSADYKKFALDASAFAPADIDLRSNAQSGGARIQNSNQLSTMTQRHRQIMRRLQAIDAAQPLALATATWMLAFSQDGNLSTAIVRDMIHRLHVEQMVDIQSGSVSTRWRSVESEKWQLVPQGKRAFKIEAGVLEIEYFHGHTNIRVMDASRVTVEGNTRGSKIKGADWDILAPLWN